MTWLAWRQFRTSALLGALALTVMAALLAMTTHGGSFACTAGNCSPTGGEFAGLSHDHLLKFLSTLLVGVPAIVGVFWGAPLVARELENGTFRLAWTQSVTRARWLWTKLVLVGLAGAVLCGLLSAMLGWWSSARVNADRMSPAMFAERGIVPIGYAVFALALAITAGVLIRRTLPGMVIGLVGFAATRMVVQFLLRPHLLPARHLSVPINAGTGLGLSSSSSGVLSIVPAQIKVGNGWTFSQRIVDGAGHAPTSAFLTSACPGLNNRVMPPSRPGHAVVVPARPALRVKSCFDSVGARFHEAIAYQPASHYWGLQLIETAIFLGLAGVLVGLTFWALRRRHA